jgi:hypothetical protein
MCSETAVLNLVFILFILFDEVVQLVVVLAKIVLLVLHAFVRARQLCGNISFNHAIEQDFQILAAGLRSIVGLAADTFILQLV